MWTQEFTPISKISNGIIVPTEHWPALLNNARETAADACRKLGSYLGSVAAQTEEFGSVDEQAFIDAAQPPMSPTEKRAFRKSLGEIWSLEDAFVMTANQSGFGVEV